jgi:hypothetical protein
VGGSPLAPFTDPAAPSTFGSSHQGKYFRALQRYFWSTAVSEGREGGHGETCAGCWFVTILQVICCSSLTRESPFYGMFCFRNVMGVASCSLPFHCCVEELCHFTSCPVLYAHRRDSHGGDYEECRLLGYKNPVRTSQETHHVSATDSTQLMLCMI